MGGRRSKAPAGGGKAGPWFKRLSGNSRQVLGTRGRNDTQQASSETGSTAMWPASGREAEVRGGIVSSLLGLLNQDAGVSSKSKCPRSSGNTNSLVSGVSLKPQSKEREHRGAERVSEQSVDGSGVDGGQHQQRVPGWT